jgi:hypothetical protein
MRSLASAIALVMLCACAGYTSGPVVVGGTPTGGGTLDGGGDAGVGAGDGGVDGGPDAGCAPLALNTVGIIDNCLGGVPQNGTGSLNVSAPDVSSACAVTISLTTGSGPCTGFASHGALDAFDGGCQGTGLVCTSPSLPGTLTCSGGCTITVCAGATVDGGVCGP